MSHGTRKRKSMSSVRYVPFPNTIYRSVFFLPEMNLYSSFVASGSGISIFVIQSNDPLNSSMTIDGDASAIASMPALPGSSNPLAYNVTLYTVQSLAATDHTLDIALLDYVYGNGTTKGSMIRFDSAAVNTISPTVVSPSSSAAGTATTASIVPGPSGSANTSHSM